MKRNELNAEIESLPAEKQLGAAKNRRIHRDLTPASPEILHAQREVELLLARIDEPEPSERIEARKEYSLSSGRKSPKAGMNEYFVLPRGAQAGRAVARLFVRSPGAGRSCGTGFLVGPGLLLTNNHMIPDAGHALNTVASFDYELGVEGELRRAQNFRATGEVFLTSETLDYTLVSIQPVSTEGVALSGYGWIPLLPKSGKALKREFVNIIQHPGGDLKKVTLRQNTVIGVKGDFIYYVTGTQPGSSGSPVFNEEWQLAALHHMTIANKHDPEKFTADRGVRISAILGDIGNRRDAGDRQAIEIDRRLQEARLAMASGAAENAASGTDGARSAATALEAGRAARSAAKARGVVSDEPRGTVVDFNIGGHRYHDNVIWQRPRSAASLRAGGRRRWRGSWA